jgi:hypothetical protein
MAILLHMDRRGAIWLLKWGSAYTDEGVTCAPMAVGGIPPDSHFNRLTGRHLIILFNNVWYHLGAVELQHFNIGKCRICEFCLIASCTQQAQ